jgi:hypothetical protein
MEKYLEMDNDPLLPETVILEEPLIREEDNTFEKTSQKENISEAGERIEPTEGPLKTVSSAGENEKIDKHKENLISEISNQIKVQCKNFLVSEFKLISIFSIAIAIFFYFFGESLIALYFCISFLLGVFISLFSAYVLTVRAVESCEITLHFSK